MQLREVEIYDDDDMWARDKRCHEIDGVSSRLDENQCNACL